MSFAWDVENLNPTTRFNFPEDESQWVELRLASDQDNKEIFQRAGIKLFEKKLVYNSKERQMQWVQGTPTDEAQQTRFSEEIWDFSIVNWKLLNKEGEEIPCTRENKIMFMRRSPKFASWVGDCLEIMREGLSVAKHEEIKN